MNFFEVAGPPAAGGEGTITTLTISDAIALIDAVLAYRFRNRLPEEPVTVTEGGVLRFHFILLESLAEVSDSIVRYVLRNRIQADGTVLIDETIVSTSGIIVVTRVLTEQLTVSDLMTRYLERNRFQPETLLVADSELDSALRNATVSDLLTVSDQTLRYVLRFRVQTDGTILIDETIVSSTGIRVRVLTEQLTVQDLLIREVDRNRAQAENVLVADSPLAYRDRNATLSDMLGIGEQTLRYAFLNRRTDDDVYIVDEIIRQLIGQILYGVRIRIGYQSEVILGAEASTKLGAEASIIVLGGEE